MACAATASVAASNTATSFIYFTIHDKSLVIYAGPAPSSPGIDFFCRLKATSRRSRESKVREAPVSDAMTRTTTAGWGCPALLELLVP